MLAAAGCSTVKPVEHPGKELPGLARCDVLASQPGFEVAMERSPAGPVIRFRGTQTVRCRDVRQFEKWIYWQVDGEADPSKIKKQFVPDQTFERAGPEREERRDTGLLAGVTATINGETAILGADGCWPAGRELLLRQFDLLEPGRPMKIVLRCTVAGRGEHALEVTRCGLFAALDVNWKVAANYSPRGLRIQVDTQPAPPRPGVPLVIRAQVTNLGNVPAVQVWGRLFSRQPWLDGRAFYFGQVPPGSRVVMERTVQVPAGVPPPDGRVFAEFAIQAPSGWKDKPAETRQTVPVAWSFAPAP